MIFEDKFFVAAPLEQTWELLLDIPRVGQCVPGVGKIEQVDDGAYKGNLVAKVGPMRANFVGQVDLIEVNPPHYLSAKARAHDQATSSMASIDFSATLTPVEAGETEVAFNINVIIRGRLGQFGQGVIRETAKQMTQLFTECVQSQLLPQTAEEQIPGVDGEPSHSGSPHSTSSTPAPNTPSLISVLIKSTVSALVNWLRSLRPTS